jgi:hypothetical protein
MRPFLVVSHSLNTDTTATLLCLSCADDFDLSTGAIRRNAHLYSMYGLQQPDAAAAAGKPINFDAHLFREAVHPQDLDRVQSTFARAASGADNGSYDLVSHSQACSPALGDGWLLVSMHHLACGYCWYMRVCRVAACVHALTTSCSRTTLHCTALHGGGHHNRCTELCTRAQAKW